MTVTSVSLSKAISEGKEAIAVDITHTTNKRIYVIVEDSANQQDTVDTVQHLYALGFIAPSMPDSTSKTITAAAGINQEYFDMHYNTLYDQSAIDLTSLDSKLLNP